MKHSYTRLTIGIMVIMVVGILAYGYVNRAHAPTGGSVVACTQEAKQCPDGSYVGRTGPNCEFAQCPSVSSTTSGAPGNGWQSYVATSTGMTVHYPETLGTTYLRAAEWPPAVALSKKAYSCSAGGTQTAASGTTENVVVNGHVYCRTMEGDGAAGSVYTSYSYAFAVGTSTGSLFFTIQAPQCVNYDEPQQSACKEEETAFSPDTLADSIVSSITMKQAVSSKEPLPI